MNQIDIINKVNNQKKELLDNALDGIILSEEDKHYISYLVAQNDLHEMQHLCNLLIKVRMQGMNT